MKTEELALQRGRILVELKKALRGGGYTFIEMENPPPNTIQLEVGHLNARDWRACVSIGQSLHPDSPANQLWIPSRFRTGDVSKHGIQRLLKRLFQFRTEAEFIQQRISQSDQTVAKFTSQKEQELAGLLIPAWVNVDVRCSGEHAGSYRVSFDSGSLIERLTAAQVKCLVTALNTLENV
jgi:hypothetical protein